MKSIKDLREQYDIITEKEESEERKLSALVRAGLYDAKKLPALKKALDKSADKMTGAEKRMLISLLDSLMSQVISNQPVYQKVKQNVQRMNEAKFDSKIKVDYLSKLDPRFDKNYSEKNIPTVLILKRKAVRVYPDFQKVALYYAQAIDKYVSIPFGEINVGGLNEARSNTSSNNTTTSSSSSVTLSTGRRVSIGRRRSNVSNIRAMIKSKSPLNAYLYKLGLKHRRAIGKYLKENRDTSMPNHETNLREEYRLKLQQMRDSRKELDESVAGEIVKGVIKYGAKYADDAVKAVSKYGPKAAGATKNLAKGSWNKAKGFGKKVKDYIKKKVSGTGTTAASLAAGAAGAASGFGSNGNDSGSNFRRPAEQGYQFGKLQPSTADSFVQKNPTNDAQAQRDYQAQKKANQAMLNPVRESVIVQMKNMIESGTPSIDVMYEDKSIMINNTVAKKIVNLYESVNETNKKKIKNMLDENASSFSKVLTFALRY